MNSREVSLMVFAVLFVLAVVSPVASLRSAPGGDDCKGCNPFRQSAWSNLGCLVVTESNPNLTKGECVVEDEDCVEDQPCHMSGEFSITNNCSGPVYIKTKVNFTCGQGTQQLNAGSSTSFHYDDDVPCGEAHSVLIYTSNPGQTCSSWTAAGGWGFTCSACQWIHP